MKYLLLFIRALLFALVIVLGLPVIMLLGWLSGGSPRPGLHIRRFACKLFTRIMNVPIKVEGKVDIPLFILVSNHRTYFDPVVNLSHVLAYPVSMAEVRRWPLIGYAAAMSGVIFVKRDNRESRRRTLEAIEEALLNGHPVLIYPEAGTHGGPTSGEFRWGTFRLAAKMGIPIIPCALDYENTSMYWVDHTPFLAHAVRELGRWRQPCRVSYGPPMTAEDPQELLERVKGWIDEKLLSYRAS